MANLVTWLEMSFVPSQGVEKNDCWPIDMVLLGWDVPRLFDDVVIVDVVVVIVVVVVLVLMLGFERPLILS